MDEITKELTKHFTETFHRHGATPEGVNWGTKTDKIVARYNVFSNGGFNLQVQHPQG